MPRRFASSGPRCSAPCSSAVSPCAAGRRCLGASRTAEKSAAHKIPVPGERGRGHDGEALRGGSGDGRPHGRRRARRSGCCNTRSPIMSAPPTTSRRAVKGWRGVIAVHPRVEHAARRRSQRRRSPGPRRGDRSRAGRAEHREDGRRRSTALLGTIAASPEDARREIFILGDLANRGVETGRIHDELRDADARPAAGRSGSRPMPPSPRSAPTRRFRIWWTRFIMTRPRWCASTPAAADSRTAAC